MLVRECVQRLASRHNQYNTIDNDKQPLLNHRFNLNLQSLSPSLVEMQNPPCTCLVAFAALDVEWFVLIIAPDCPSARPSYTQTRLHALKQDKE